MTKTTQPSLSHYSSTKWGVGEGGKEGAYFKFWPIGRALIREGGGGGGATCNSRIYSIPIVASVIRRCCLTCGVLQF